MASCRSQPGNRPHDQPVHAQISGDTERQHQSQHQKHRGAQCPAQLGHLLYLRQAPCLTRVAQYLQLPLQDLESWVDTAM